MLVPHDPSKNLRPPERRPVPSTQDQADVHITIVPSTRLEPGPAAAAAVPSGRSASINARPPA